MKRWVTPSGIATLAGFGVLLSGCFLWTTAGEGDEHETRIAQLEAQMQQQSAALRGEIDRAHKQVKQLSSILNQATKVVTRTSADTGARVEELRAQLSTLEGQLAETRNTMESFGRDLMAQRSQVNQSIEQVARRAGLDMPIDTSQIPSGKLEHFQAAQRAYQAGEHSKARALFREYITRYAQDEHADAAQYWIGASYLAENRPATALGELRKVVQNYATGDAVDDALMDMAEAFWRLHSCTDARRTLEALIRMRGSPLLQRARTKLREVQRAPRSQCTS